MSEAASSPQNRFRSSNTFSHAKSLHHDNTQSKMIPGAYALKMD